MKPSVAVSACCAELAATVQHGYHRFKGRQLLLEHDVGANGAAVARHRGRIPGVEEPSAKRQVRVHLQEYKPAEALGLAATQGSAKQAAI